MSTGTSDVILEAKDVSRSFRGLQALADYNLRLHTGEILGVIGPNGAGKTTLFNVITGFLPPTSGTIRLRDQDITGKNPDQVTALGIARTFQNIRLFARMTVLDNVKTAQQLHGKAGFWETIFSTPSFLKRSAHLRSAPTLISSRSAWPASPMSTPPRCPMGSSASWRSPARWRPNPRFCCWTSRQPA